MWLGSLERFVAVKWKCGSNCRCEHTELYSQEIQLSNGRNFFLYFSASYILLSLKLKICWSTPWCSGLSCCFLGQHLVSECHFELQLICIWHSSQLVHLGQKQRLDQVRGSLPLRGKPGWSPEHLGSLLTSLSCCRLGRCSVEKAAFHSFFLSLALPFK